MKTFEAYFLLYKYLTYKIMFKKTLLFLLAFLPLISFAQSLTIDITNDGAWIKEAGEKVLFYQAETKSKDGEYPRANYIHPLYNVDGTELTEDFPKDHPHHRGIFWTWHQVIIGEKKIGDAWLCKDFVWDVANMTKEKSADGKLSFNVKTYWKSPLWLDANGMQKPFLDENTKITIYEKEKNYRVIDFEISLLAMERDLKIGGSDDKKGYGGFSVRMKMPEDIKFTSGTGEVTPAVGPVSAGSWMDVSGSLAADGGGAGIVMICHPENPMFPEKWILRAKPGMQNPAFPGQLPVAVSDKEPTVSKYRLVVYTGKLKNKQIKGLLDF